MTDTRSKKEVRHDECGGLAFYSYAGGGEFGTIPSAIVHDLEMPDGSKPPVGEVLTCGANIGNHLAITLNGDTFGDQIFLDHVAQCVAFDVFGMAALRQAIG